MQRATASCKPFVCLYHVINETFEPTTEAYYFDGITHGKYSDCWIVERIQSENIGHMSRRTSPPFFLRTFGVEIVYAKTALMS